MRYELICKIKEITPEIKGLTNKKKEVLMKIYKSLKEKNNKSKKLKKYIKSNNLKK